VTVRNQRKRKFKKKHQHHKNLLAPITNFYSVIIFNARQGSDISSCHKSAHARCSSHFTLSHPVNNCNIEMLIIIVSTDVYNSQECNILHGHQLPTDPSHAVPYYNTTTVFHTIKQCWVVTCYK